MSSDAYAATEPVNAHQALVSPHHAPPHPITPVKGKEFVLLVMDFKKYDNDDLHSKHPLGTKMYWFGCPNCKEGDTYKYTVRQPVNWGYKNPSDHFYKCVGCPVSVEKILKERSEIKAAQLAEEKRDGKVAATATRVQQTLQHYHFLPSKQVRSLNMWIKFISLKNMPVGLVECDIQRELVAYPEVRSTKTVLATAHHLVEIVEQKIAARMKKSPGGQLLFDGYSQYGVHYVALFVSFMYTTEHVVDGVTHTLWRHI